MKDFILTHYPLIRQVIFYMSIVYVILFIFFIGPVISGHFQLVHTHFICLMKLYRSNKSTATQLELITDQTASIQRTIHAALQASDLSTEHHSEMLEMLKICTIIRRNAPHSPSLIESYLDDLDELLERLQEIVPPTLYSLNPYFFQSTPPRMTPLQWCQRKVRCNRFIATMFSFMALSQLISGTKYPRILHASFLSIVLLTLYIVYLYRYLRKNHVIKDMDDACLKCYQSGYNYMLFVLLLTLILYVVVRFLLFS